MENKNTDFIAYGSYDIYIGRFLCLAYAIISLVQVSFSSFLQLFAALQAHFQALLSV
jgi:hypothetical protein